MSPNIDHPDLASSHSVPPSGSKVFPKCSNYMFEKQKLAAPKQSLRWEQQRHHWLEIVAEKLCTSKLCLEVHGTYTGQMETVLAKGLHFPAHPDYISN